MMTKSHACGVDDIAITLTHSVVTVILSYLWFKTLFSEWVTLNEHYRESFRERRSPFLSVLE